MATIHGTHCCGLVEIDGVGDSNRASIISAIKAARTQRAGRVFATTTRGQAAAVGRLKDLGFQAVEEFQNPNTGHYVTIWLRSTGPVPPSNTGRITKLVGAIKR